MDARRAPKNVVNAHPLDQCPQIDLNGEPNSLKTKKSSATIVDDVT